jgi:membrane protease YdiL (CAAX protease family)
VSAECKKAIGFVAILDIIFVVFLSLSGSFKGFLSTIFYILAFIAPIFMGYLTTREENSDLEFLGLGDAKITIPFIAPTIGVVMLISYLTSLIISALGGGENSVELGDNLILALVSHAVVPAIFEEALFRYIPMRVMKKESPVLLLAYSSIFFALIHHSFFSIPYALFAGIMFMAVDLMAKSVWPSVVIHFLNNAVSVLLMFYKDVSIVSVVIISLVAALAAASVIFIIINKDRYGEFAKKRADLSLLKSAPPKEIWVLAVPMLIVAVLEILQ